MKNAIGKLKSDRTKSLSHKARQNGAPISLPSSIPETPTQALLSTPSEPETKQQNDRDAGQPGVVEADTHRIAAIVGRHNGDASWGRIFANIKANRS
jgi:hypothetical protein